MPFWPLKFRPGHLHLPSIQARKKIHTLTVCISFFSQYTVDCVYFSGPENASVCIRVHSCAFPCVFACRCSAVTFPCVFRVYFLRVHFCLPCVYLAVCIFPFRVYSVCNPCAFRVYFWVAVCIPCVFLAVCIRVYFEVVVCVAIME